MGTYAKLQQPLLKMFSTSHAPATLPIILGVTPVSTTYGSVKYWPQSLQQARDGRRSSNDRHSLGRLLCGAVKSTRPLVDDHLQRSRQRSRTVGLQCRTRTVVLDYDATKAPSASTSATWRCAKNVGGGPDNEGRSDGDNSSRQTRRQTGRLLSSSTAMRGKD